MLPAGAARRMFRLFEILAALGLRPPEFQSNRLNGAPDLAVTEIFVGLPLGRDLTLALLYPVEPLCGLLDGAGLERARRFVEEAAGTWHPLYGALEQLARARAGDQERESS